MMMKKLMFVVVNLLFVAETIKAMDRDSLLKLVENNTIKRAEGHIKAEGHISKEDELKYADDVEKGFIDAFRVFGIPRTATDDEIEKVYRKLAMQYHPDRAIINKLTAKEATDIFNVINGAQILLHDYPEQRKNFIKQQEEKEKHKFADNGIIAIHNESSNTLVHVYYNENKQVQFRVGTGETLYIPSIKGRYNIDKITIMAYGSIRSYTSYWVGETPIYDHNEQKLLYKLSHAKDAGLVVFNINIATGYLGSYVVTYPQPSQDITKTEIDLKEEKLATNEDCRRFLKLPTDLQKEDAEQSYKVQLEALDLMEKAFGGHKKLSKIKTHKHNLTLCKNNMYKGN